MFRLNSGKKNQEYYGVLIKKVRSIVLDLLKQTRSLQL